MVAQRTICVIGSGISGLAAAKAFRERGHHVTVMERGPDLGGVWEPSRSYPDVRTQTPRDIYAFSDMAMPADYPEWPAGGQVHAYLRAYAERFGLVPAIRFGCTVTGLTKRPGQGWDVTTAGADGTAGTQTYDFVAICTGQFSQKNAPTHPGADAFRAAGGAILHSSEHADAEAVRGRRVVVLGYSKSATDVAVSAVRHGAAAVTIVYREPAWKIPYFFGGLVNFKRILYCRAAEAMFLPFDAGPVRRLAHRLATPLIWANWRALEALLTAQFALRRSGLRPRTRIEDDIHCNLAVETPGFYAMVADGRITARRGTIAAYEGGTVRLTGGERVAADLVVMATGWRQEVPILAPADRARLVDPDGQYRLYRMMVNPDLADLGFVGFNSSFATTLSAELGAAWLVRYMDGRLARQPTRARMEAEIARSLAWRRGERPAAAHYGGLCIAPYHNRHFGDLLGDIGVPTREANPLTALFAPLRPPVYARLLARAPAYRAEPADRQAAARAA
ncbi:flavin-containing monooxygenase [Methylobacterium nonmethylotrophicum]|uniref:Trimethylamine monooxygenase n=1 Tax=Methylobacterium nonmethylotrophicum TaxID=1141884 RepID=A0A4Z0NP19_9HYPH|nr:NAD(P)/FAD-dependent oxidoreductase [Methylobacterium nonmethylotrophicum]TGD98569.1 NAD(P)/FAD-dependent oxidoreductase [Methylobacterium nonmethylotrophicum]